MLLNTLPGIVLFFERSVSRGYDDAAYKGILVTMLCFDSGVERHEEGIHIVSVHQVRRLVELALNGYITVRISLLGHEVNAHIMTFGVSPLVPKPDI